MAVFRYLLDIRAASDSDIQVGMANSSQAKMSSEAGMRTEADESWILLAVRFAGKSGMNLEKIKS